MLKLSRHEGVCKHDYIIGAWQQFFPTFQLKGSRGENSQNAQKCEQKKEFCYTIYAWGKCTKMQPKKEFLYTIRAGAKNLDFSGKPEFVDTIRAHRKFTKTYTKKRFNDTTHAREYSDISDTLKRGLLKNTNIRHIGRVVEQIGRTPGQAAAAFPFFQPLKVSRDFRVPKKGLVSSHFLHPKREQRAAGLYIVRYDRPKKA